MLSQCITSILSAPAVLVIAAQHLSSSDSPKEAIDVFFQSCKIPLINLITVSWLSWLWRLNVSELRLLMIETHSDKFV